MVPFGRKKIKIHLTSQGGAFHLSRGVIRSALGQGRRLPARLAAPVGFSLTLALGLPGSAWAAGVPTLEEVQVSANQEDLAGVADSASVAR